MKQEIMMWAVINNVTQEVCRYADGEPAMYTTRDEARGFNAREKGNGRNSGRVRRVRVTIEDA